MGGIQEEVKQLREAMVMQARFDERLIALQREVADLRHGKGFITNDNNHEKPKHG
jgi:hypothetical protein